MNLIEYLALDEMHTVLPEQSRSLIADLANRPSSDTPMSDRARVADYLTMALNMQSIEHDLVPAIERLLQDLQLGK